MLLSTEKYKTVITLALDDRLEKLKGSIVFDNFDFAVEGDKIYRARLQRFLKRKNIAGLEKMLQELIQRLRLKDRYAFLSDILKDTGYEIEPDLSTISVSTKRKVTAGEQYVNLKLIG